jgi:hypothetical protein
MAQRAGATCDKFLVRPVANYHDSALLAAIFLLVARSLADRPLKGRNAVTAFTVGAACVFNTTLTAH